MVNMKINYTVTSVLIFVFDTELVWLVTRTKSKHNTGFTKRTVRSIGSLYVRSTLRSRN